MEQTEHEMDLTSLGAINARNASRRGRVLSLRTVAKSDLFRPTFGWMNDLWNKCMTDAFIIIILNKYMNTKYLGTINIINIQTQEFDFGIIMTEAKYESWNSWNKRQQMLL